MKPLFSSLALLALLLLAAPAFAASPAPSASPDGCGVDLARLVAASAAPLCSSNPGDRLGPVQPAPLDLALAPHCCSTSAVDACRESCKLIAPGCKGVIGCRAGECVCTCDCP